MADGDSTMSWSDLPAGLVAAIADELTDLSDLKRFRLVCPSWRSATAAHAARLRVPLLLLPTELRVWSVANDRLRDVPVPAARGHAFLFASSHGWMLAVARDFAARLVYPFSGDSAALPALPFTSSRDADDNEKIIRDLAWDWSPHGVVVSPGKGEGAFFSRPGDQTWRPVGCSSIINSVTYCEGSFYLFDGRTCTGTVVDAETLAVVAEIKPPPLVEMRRYWEFEGNLAVSHDELLLVVRTDLLHTGYRGLPRLCKAFRADRTSGGGQSPSGWSEVAGGIGDRAVFVDHFRAFCVEANGVIRRNCMYVASAREEVNDDYGMDVCGRCTVEILDLGDLTTRSLWYGNLLKVRGNRFEQWPSWSLPKLH